ncbi:MAG: hypothetical protein IBX55_01445 [Methyloprofundus sp.]|nr:hypothetical protein [Methyloprofundus sp.]
MTAYTLLTPIKGSAYSEELNARSGIESLGLHDNPKHSFSSLVQDLKGRVSPNDIISALRSKDTSFLESMSIKNNTVNNSPIFTQGSLK